MAVVYRFTQNVYVCICAKREREKQSIWETKRKEHMTFIEHDGCFIIVYFDVFESNVDRSFLL